MSLFHHLLRVAAGETPVVNLPNPVSRYTFDGVTGALVPDVAGENDGTLYGSAAIIAEGKFGDALNIPGGSDNRMEAPSTSSLQVTGDLTLSMWVKIIAWPTSITHASLIEKMSGDSSGEFVIRLRTYSGGDCQFYYGAGGPKILTCSPYDLFELDNWVHVCAVRKVGEYMRLYKNGSMVAERLTDIPTATATGVPLVVGRRIPSGPSLNSHIDDLRIFDQALSESQIVSLAGTSSPDLTILDQALAVWSADNIAGTVWSDSSDNALDMTLSGDPSVISTTEGNALRFDGVDDVARRSGNNLLTGDMTIVAKVRVVGADPATDMAFISQGRDSSGGWSINFYVNAATLRADIVTASPVAARVVEHTYVSSMTGVWQTVWVRNKAGVLTIGFDTNSSLDSLSHGGSGLRTSSYGFVVGENISPTKRAGDFRKIAIFDSGLSDSDLAAAISAVSA